MSSKYLLIRLLTVTLFLNSFIKYTNAQETKLDWDLNQCLNYALEHNIQVNKKKLAVESSSADYFKTKSERLPSLSASLSESITNSKDNTSSSKDAWTLANSTSASLSSSITIFDGGSISNRISASSLNIDIANLDVEATKNNITLSITQAYLNILYAKESVDYANEVVVTSQKQVERAKELLNAGSIARFDLVQLEAQYASDSYSLVVAKNTLTTDITNLKQLLEITVTDTFNIKFPEVDYKGDYLILPTINDAFNTSLSIMPEIKSGEINREVASINVKVAQAGYAPTLSLSANYSSDFSSLSSNSFSSQLSNNQMQRVGLSLSIPIFNRFSTKTTVQKSKINLKEAELSFLETKKNLLQTVETVYQNTVAGKSRYDAAIGQHSSANESYKISEEQFNLGMLNSVDLLKAKNTLLSAQKELVQSKYTAILNRKILDFYMGKPITL